MFFLRVILITFKCSSHLSGTVDFILVVHFGLVFYSVSFQYLVYLHFFAKLLKN